MKNKLFLYINVSLITFAFLGGLAVAAWSNPPGNPPSGNPDSPLTVGSSQQVKRGPLSINLDGTLSPGLVVEKNGIIINDLKNCDSGQTLDTNGSGKIVCGVDLDEQTLSRNGDNIIISKTNSAVIAPYSDRSGVATNIANGANRQIPFQTGPGATSFSPNLLWVNENKEIWVRDPAVGTSVIGVDSITSKNIEATIKFFGVDAELSNNLSVGNAITANKVTSNEFCLSGTLPSGGCRGLWPGLNDVIEVSDGSAGGHNINNVNTLTASTLVANKITANTIDPVYSIGGINYATYMAGMTGVKEETTGVVKLANGAYVMDFDEEAAGSDLWLFSKASNLKNNFDKLVVILTPSFDGKVWYEKDVANNRLIFYGSSDSEVSYRLTAPRFDSAEWTNYNTDIGVKGLIIKD